MTSKGVIYVAFGDKYVAEAVRSAQSVKTHTPPLPITLFTNCPVSEPVFDCVVQAPSRPYEREDKPRYMAQTPYERTLFLDTDTFVCGDIEGLFDLLDQFDFAAAHGPDRVSRYDVPVLPDVIAATPSAFPQFNSGVVLYKQSPAMPAFFAEWERLIQRNLQLSTARGIPRWNDQTSLREAIYLSSLRVATLTPEYQCHPGFAGFLSGPVKILHSRRKDLARVAETLNQSTDQRVFVNLPGDMRLYTRSKVLAASLPGIGTRLRNSVRTRGVAGTLRAVLNKVRLGNA